MECRGTSTSSGANGMHLSTTSSTMCTASSTTPTVAVNWWNSVDDGLETRFVTIDVVARRPHATERYSMT